MGALEILGHHLLALSLGLFLEEAPANAVHVVLATPVQELAHALVGIRSLCGRAREQILEQMRVPALFNLDGFGGSEVE